MKTIPIIQLGIGNVGGEVVRNVLAYNNQHKDYSFRYIGIANSTATLFRGDGIPEEILAEILSTQGFLSTLRLAGMERHNRDLSPLLHNIMQSDLRGLSIIDTTDSSAHMSFLLECAKRGTALVLANKKPLVKEMSTFRVLNQVRPGCRATVGAGLPVIPAVENLLSCGERIHKIEGCFSGSLGILCSSLEAGELFSAVVKELKEKGYTEPDPREDLSGVDMARKILIISRLCGQHMEFDDIEIKSLFPKRMFSLSANEFLSDLESLDDKFRNRFNRANHKNCTFRFVATFENGKCQVGLKEVSKESLFGRLEGTEKLAVIHTDRNKGNPLVIKGSGAGAKSAAKDVFDDLIKISTKNLPVRSGGEGSEGCIPDAPK